MKEIQYHQYTSYSYFCFLMFPDRLKIIRTTWGYSATYRGLREKKIY